MNLLQSEEAQKHQKDHEDKDEDGEEYEGLEKRGAEELGGLTSIRGNPSQRQPRNIRRIC